MAVRVGGRPHHHPRSPAQGDRQAQEPAVHGPGRRRRTGGRAAPPADQPGSAGRAVPRRRAERQGRPLRLDRRPAPGWPLRRTGGGEAAPRRRATDSRQQPRRVPPRDEGRGAGPGGHPDRQPPGDRARHPVGHRHLRGGGGPVHPDVLPALAGGPADRRPGGHRHGDGLRRRPVAVRLRQLVDGVPGFDHRRQRHQLRHHPDVPLPGTAGGRRRPGAGPGTRPSTACWPGPAWRPCVPRRRTPR